MRPWDATAVLAMSYPGEAGPIAYNARPCGLTAGNSRPRGATAVSAVREMRPWDATDVLAMSYPGEAGPTAHNARPWNRTAGDSPAWKSAARSRGGWGVTHERLSQPRPWATPCLWPSFSRATGQPASTDRPAMRVEEPSAAVRRGLAWPMIGGTRSRRLSSAVETPDGLTPSAQRVGTPQQTTDSVVCLRLSGAE
jgi:hypothetical protein